MKTNYQKCLKCLRQAIRITIVAIIAFPLIGCASSQKRAERNAQIQKALDEAFASRQLRINITSMSTARYGTRTTSFGFFLEINGDKLISNLPYLGQVYRAPISTTPLGLNFEAPIQYYEESLVKKGLKRIDLQVRTEEDVYVYSIEVYETGRALIRVRGQYRESISFDGDCDLP